MVEIEKFNNSNIVWRLCFPNPAQSIYKPSYLILSFLVSSVWTGIYNLHTTFCKSINTECLIETFNLSKMK